MAGNIIAVMGGKGGVGKSQFCVNFSFAYAEVLRAKVALLDFDQAASGDLNLITGLKGQKTIKDLAEFSGAIDPKTIIPFITQHPNGVNYVGMPNDPAASKNIDAEGLGKTLKAITNLYPITVIDCGSELTPLALKALEFSTMILLVTTPDILALNQTKRLYSDLITLLYPKDMIQLIFNQAQAGHPVTADSVSKQMGKPVLSSIPRDDQACVAALASSKPVFLIGKTSAFSKGITDCVNNIVQKNILKALEKIAKPENVGKAPAAAGASSENDDEAKRRTWMELKTRIHKALVEEMDLKKSDDSDPKARTILREQTKKLVVELLGKEDSKIASTREAMNQIVKEILDEALGLGPLEDLLRDKECSEIMVVGPYKIFYEKKGKIRKSEIIFTNDRQVLNVIERIVAPIGRRIDEKTPYVDARLSDGSRVHAIIPPCALDGCVITIRKFPENRLTWKDLVKFGSMTQNMADFLRIAVEAHRNIIISGGTGSGKTTLINVLGGFIQADERIITCEDAAELDFPQDHIVRLETRPPSLEGEGEVDMRCLVKQTLRMRPTRIVVGECRGGETLDMLQAMGTGHDGSMTTVHSNNPRECIGRVETLVQYAGIGLSGKAIRELIANAVHMIVQQSRLEDGSRKVLFVTEIGGMQGEVVTLQDIFLFRQQGITKEGKVQGEFQATGFIPKFIETLERKGYNIPRGIFTNSQNQPAPAAAPTKPDPNQKPGQSGGQNPPPKK